MKTIRFILEKIVIIEVMLLILFFIKSFFGIEIALLDMIINTSLKYLTPISIVALVLYIILCILSSKIIETAIGVIIGGLILYYLLKYLN